MSCASFTNLPASAKFAGSSVAVGRELPASLGQHRLTFLLISAAANDAGFCDDKSNAAPGSGVNLPLAAGAHREGRRTSSTFLLGILDVAWLRGNGKYQPFR
jgi:hypothetical protein